MNRTVLLVAVAVASLAVLSLPAMGMTPTTGGATQVDGNATAPGEQLSGVVGVQGAELDGALDQRAFGIQFSQAADNDTKAAVLADRLQTVEQQLAELRDRKATLEAQRDTGEITDGKYRAEMAKVATQIRVLSAATNQTEQAAGNVPAAALEGRGVNATAIQTLRDRASELSGPEVAAIARDIAGPGVGETPGRGNGAPPVNGTGPPGADSNRGNGAANDRANRSEPPRNDSADGRQSPPDDSREHNTREAGEHNGNETAEGNRDDTADAAGDSEPGQETTPGNETVPGEDGPPTETGTDDGTQTDTPTDADSESPGNDRTDDATASETGDEEDDDDEGDSDDSGKEGSSKTQR